MGRLIRKTAILAELEANYGVDPTPTGAANAILVSNASFAISYSNVNRDLIRAHLGGSEQLAGTRFVECSFDVELANSGTAGTAPAWSPLLQACGFAESVLTTPNRVEFLPVSASFQSLTIYYHIDGTLRKVHGAMGNAEIMMNEGERPMIRFSFVGLDGGVSATADPSLTLTSWQVPTVVSDVNSGDINLGATYAAGVLTSGTDFPSRGLSINAGNVIARKAILGGQSVSITQRDMTGSCQLELTPAQESSFMTAINANTTTTLAFTHGGSGAGVGIILHAPNVQRIDPTDTDYEGELHTGLSLRFVPSSGNDELRIVCL